MATVKVSDDTTTIHDIGSYIMSYQPYQNAFTTALVNRIGRVLVTSRMWRNPWAVFKRGRLEYGETVEEIFANIANPNSFDPEIAESQVFKRTIPDVRAAFHTMNYQKFYKVTISVEQLRQAFISYSELTSLISYIVDSLYNAMNLDEYLVMKYMLCREALNGGIYPVTTSAVEGTDADPESVISAYREYTNNLTFLKSTYNRARVRNATSIADQVIIIPNHIEAVLGTQVLASAFNLNEVDYISKRIALDSFTFDSEDLERLAEIFENDAAYEEFTATELDTLETINAVKMDKGWFMVFDNLEQFTENYNGQGLYWQYFYHVWRTFSVSPFANAVLFTTETGTITGVTVSPTTATVELGGSVTFTATVSGTGIYDESVVWSVSCAESSGTSINANNGTLTVSKNETATSLVVTATAADGTTATAVVSVGSATE